MVKDLRGVVIVIEVVETAWGGALQVIDAADDSVIARPCAEIETAQEADGRHGRSRARIRVPVAAAIGRVHGIEVFRRLGEGRILGIIHLQSCHLAALEGHDLPAAYGRVAPLAGLVTPAAILTLRSP